MKNKKLNDRNLYLVTGQECSLGRATIEVVKAAILGGVDIVQMREKTFSAAELKELGVKLSKICSGAGVKFIVNDDPYLAKEVGADGVHLGQEDLKKFPIDTVRRILGPDGIIGVSTHSLQEAEIGMTSDADYIAFGPVFPTKTKDYFVGISDVPGVLGLGNKPVVMIGGINGDNIDQLLSLGAGNIAMIRHITEASDIEKEVRRMKEKIFSSGSSGTGVNIRINGVVQAIGKEMSIFELVESRGLRPERVVIEHNDKIVLKDMWSEVSLRGGDNVEIVSFVGGG